MIGERSACLFLLNLILVFSQFSFAQSTAVPQKASFNATVVEEGALVFQEDNFDSEPVAQLHEGEIIEVSRKEYGSYNFHRVRLKDGRVGYMADNDFKAPGLKASEPTEKQKNLRKAAKAKKQEMIEEKRKHLPFAQTSYYGFTYDYVGFRESTFALQPTSNMSFLGVKVLGPGLLMEGDTVTEFNANISPGAPGYYQQATGNSASGWVLHMDALLLYPSQQSKRVLTFFGMGPMFRYSHFQVALTNKTTQVVNNYSLDDMTVGANFDLGFAVRFSDFAIRAEYKYYWETMQYWGLGTSVLIPF
jgi:hypothetical protein